jgi:hypothetical protein
VRWLQVATAAVEEGTLGATFTVAAAASIPADGQPHTVRVCGENVLWSVRQAWHTHC